VLAHPSVAEYLVNERRQHLLDLETRFSKRILVKGQPSFGASTFTVRFD